MPHRLTRRPLPRAALALAALLAACAGPKPEPRYHLGEPYQARGVWYYPRESFDLRATGLGSVLPGQRTPLTTNGEPYDPGAMAAAHPTLQLPAIARLTNLENGLSTVVRINDRGSGDPHRLVEFTPRVALLLRVPANAVVQVELTVLGPESQEAAAALPGAPRLAIATAPLETIATTDLAPPPGIAAARPGPGRALQVAATAASTTPSATITRLPETLVQEQPRPGRLMVRLGTFEEYQYAAIQRARVAGLAPRLVQFREGRTRRFRVELGPFSSVAQAEAAQDQALAAGIPDARIVVD